MLLEEVVACGNKGIWYCADEASICQEIHCTPQSSFCTNITKQSPVQSNKSMSNRVYVTQSQYLTSKITLWWQHIFIPNQIHQLKPPSSVINTLTKWVYSIFSSFYLWITVVNSAVLKKSCSTLYIVKIFNNFSIRNESLLSAENNIHENINSILMAF